MTPTDIVAKMMVDHLIDFKRCDSHDTNTDDMEISMEEFVEHRYNELAKIPDFSDPDFAQLNRLPPNARLADDPKDTIKDEWRKLSGEPLWNMTKVEWQRCCETVGQMFTGQSMNIDEDENQRQLSVGKGDWMTSDSEIHRNHAKGLLRFDIDSVLALFTDLSMIKSMLRLTIVPLPTKNLQSDVHIIHNRVPLHWIPHFHLGTFGHDPTFDLFIFLPSLYNKNCKRKKNNLFNHVQEQTISEFMNLCLLPAIKEVLDDDVSQGWDFDYYLNQAKCHAIGLEGHIHHSQRDRFRSQTHFDLDSKYIAGVWTNCRRRLKRSMSKKESLRAFKGFQFFISCKNYKYRSGVDEFSELMNIYEDKVETQKI